MDPFFGWTAAVLATYLAGCDLIENDTSANDRSDVPSQDVSEHESDVSASSTNTQPFGQSTRLAPASPTLPGGFPASPPRLLLKRRARHQHGSPKRQRVSAEAYKLDSPSPTVARKKRRGKSKPSSPEDSDARVKVHLPRRALSIPPTPVPYNETSQSTSPSSTENTGLDVQVARPGPTSPPSSVDATSVQGRPWPLVADNVVIGRKRPAPAEFDDEVSMPHRKKYITGWMSEYIRLRAPSWREMLRAMQEARWRPFRPQVVRYLSPAPPSAPSMSSRYGCANPTTGDMPVVILAASPPHRAETPPPSSLPPSPDDPSPFLLATTTPPYSPLESPLPFTPPSSPHLEAEAVTPPDTPTPPSGVAYSLAWSVHDRAGSPSPASQIPWADKGKWRADASPERVAYRPDPAATESPTPAATDLPPSLPFPIHPPSPSLPEVPPSSTTPTTFSYHPRLSTLRTDRPRPVSNSKQSKVRREGLRRLKSTRLEPTKLAYLKLRSQVKWQLREICRRKRFADRPDPQARTRLPLPLSLPPPPPSLILPPLPIPQRTDITRAAVPTPKRFKAIKRSHRLKATRPKPFKMEYLRLRSEVRWRLKDLGFEKRPPPPPPPPPVVPTRPIQVHPIPVMIGLIPALLWPVSVFHTPPSPVAPTPRRTNWDTSTRISVLASQDSPKRAYRPRRRRRLIPDDPMVDVEFFDPPP